MDEAEAVAEHAGGVMIDEWVRRCITDDIKHGVFVGHLSPAHKKVIASRPSWLHRMIQRQLKSVTSG